MSVGKYLVSFKRTDAKIPLGIKEQLWAKVSKIETPDNLKRVFPQPYVYALLLNGLIYDYFRTRTEAFNWIKKRKSTYLSEKHQPFKYIKQ